MKDLFHICLEPEFQCPDMTFRLCNLGSKGPHLYRAYVLGVCNNLGSTVHMCYYNVCNRGGSSGSIEPLDFEIVEISPLNF